MATLFPDPTEEEFTKEFNKLVAFATKLKNKELQERLSAFFKAYKNYTDQLKKIMIKTVGQLQLTAAQLAISARKEPLWEFVWRNE